MPSLDFKGKAFVNAHHLTVPFRELVPDAKKSCLPKGTAPALDGNLIIHGDNLHALKALLPLYAGKVDCVFIDPPYNTGNEGWCYNDNVRSPVAKEWLKKASPVDKEDLERHDKWACMMWPRLKLLHELLAEDGVIFITIDDNEVHRLRMLMDEVFGEDAFVASIAWQKRTSPESRKKLGPAHDTIHVFSKRQGQVRFSKLKMTEEQIAEFSNSDNDPKGDWTSTDLTAQNIDPEKRKDQQYKITLPNGEIVSAPPGRCWSMLEPEFLRLKKEKRIWFGVNGNARPRVKTYLSESEGISSWTWWPNEDAGHNQEAKKEILEILGPGNPFDYPKPTRLLTRILELCEKQDALVLDSFGGSGTTAHAVLAQNKKDGGKRHFILVECEDYADTLTAERVRRVIRGYPFSGTKRTELMREPINWTKLKKADALVEKAESIKPLEGADYDEVKITVEAGELVVTGEMTIKDKAPGIPGAFTYCTLGAEMSLEGLLTGKDLPAFEALAKYVFYTATGRTLATVVKQPTKGGDGLIGEVEHYRVHLIYQPDQAWLRSEAAVLTETKVEAIVAGRPAGQRSLVFAAAKYLSQKDLTGRGVEFCQLPYAIHRILGESAPRV